MFFHLVDSTDKSTAETGLTGAAQICDVGSNSFTTAANGIVEIGSGIYSWTPASTEVDAAGSLAVRVTGTGAMDAFGVLQIEDPAAVAQAANVTQWNSATVATPAVSGVPKVDVTHAAGSTVQAANGYLQVNAIQWASTTIPAPTITGVPKVDTTHMDGSVVVKASGVLSVNVTRVADTAQTARDLGANLDVAVSTRLASASYTAPLDAAGTRAAVGLAFADLDTQLAAIAGYIDTEVGAVQADVSTLLDRVTAARMTYIDELAWRQGLDATKPVLVTPTAISFGSVTLGLSTVSTDTTIQRA